MRLSFRTKGLLEGRCSLVARRVRCFHFLCFSPAFRFLGLSRGMNGVDDGRRVGFWLDVRYGYQWKIYIHTYQEFLNVRCALWSMFYLNYFTCILELMLLAKLRKCRNTNHWHQEAIIETLLYHRDKFYNNTRTSSRITSPLCRTLCLEHCV